MQRSRLYRRFAALFLILPALISGELLAQEQKSEIAVRFSEHEKLPSRVVFEASAEPERGILSSHLHADGRFADALKLDIWDISKKPYVTHEMIDEGIARVKMRGREVFRMAVTKMPEVTEEALAFNGLSLDQLKLFIPHQANLRINQFRAAKLEVPEEKFFSNIEKYGNTTAGSIPIALGEALEQGAFGEGDTIVLVAFGAGFTWGATVIKW